MSRPLNKDAAIAVLGGGVSGLTFAAEMQERGFTRVTVFEREARVGGKSCTVEIDGRPHDLGATMGVPIDYRPVLKRSSEAGIRTMRFPQERHFSLATGRETALNRWRDIPGVLFEAAKYVALHATKWRSPDGPGREHAPASLYRPWADVVEEHGLETVNRRTLAYRAGYGYGFDDEIPGVLYADLFRPQTILGLALSHSFMWDGGTQPIWEALAKRLDVRTSTSVERIERNADGVVVHTCRGLRRAAERFDALVITINPKDALHALDATTEETAWFSQVRTYPYATFACDVDGLVDGEASIGYLDDNMARDRAGHPMAWVKRYADQNLFVFHLFAPAELSDAEITARIGADVARLGGTLRGVRASRRWAFFPHFPSSFMLDGGLSRVAEWQGRTNTYLIGEVLSFATMARVAELATQLAQRLADAAVLADPVVDAQPVVVEPDAPLVVRKAG